METRYLHEFIILAEEKNYWRAAERLYMNQSTLSKHIKVLEALLEVPLLERTTRAVELTDYGHAFLPYAQTMVRTEFECISALRLEKEVHSNGVHISSIPTLAQYGLANLLVSFRNGNLDYPLHVEEIDSYASLRALSQRRCELSFCWDLPSSLLPEGVRPVVRLPFFREQLVAVVAKSHPLSSRKTISLLDLREENLCFMKGYFFDLASSACQQAGFIPHIACSTDYIENILDVVSNDGHAALLPAQCIRYAQNSSQYVRETFSLLNVSPAIQATLSLCHLEDVPLSPAGQRFLDFYTAWTKADQNNEAAPM